MAFDSAGNYVLPAAPNFPAVSGTAIVAGYYNVVINDLAAAINACLTRDGQGKPSANIDWNGKNLSGVAALTVTGAGTFGSVATGTITSSGLATFASMALGAPLSAQYGGTGVNGAAAANGAVLIGNGAGFTLATLTAGSGVTITNGAGTITIAASGGGAGTTTNALTFAASGGVAPGTTFNGSAARTIDYSSVGAQPDAARVQTVANGATITPTFTNDLVTVTAQNTNFTLANPTGTAVEGKGIVIRIKDNGTARTIAYGSKYRAIGITLPTTTVINKTLYLAMLYNITDDKWDVLSVQQEA